MQPLPASTTSRGAALLPVPQPLSVSVPPCPWRPSSAAASPARPSNARAPPFAAAAASHFDGCSLTPSPSTPLPCCLVCYLTFPRSVPTTDWPLHTHLHLIHHHLPPVLTQHPALHPSTPSFHIQPYWLRTALRTAAPLPRRLAPSLCRSGPGFCSGACPSRSICCCLWRLREAVV